MACCADPHPCYVYRPDTPRVTELCLCPVIPGTDVVGTDGRTLWRLVPVGNSVDVLTTSDWLSAD